MKAKTSTEWPGKHPYLGRPMEAAVRVAEDGGSVTYEEVRGYHAGDVPGDPGARWIAVEGRGWFVTRMWREVRL